MIEYSLLLFDWDGCLARTLPIVFDAYKTTFKDYGKDVTDDYISKEILGHWDAPKKLGIEEIDVFNKKFLDRVHDDYHKVTLYNGAKEILEYYKNLGKKIMLVTTSGDITILPAIKDLGLEGIFDDLITADRVTNYKPDPESLELAMYVADVKKDKTIIVGDSKSDLGAARNAGTDSALVYPEDHKDLHDIEELKSYNPTYIVENLEELKKYIR